MDREERVLQDGIETGALHRRVRDPDERIGRKRRVADEQKAEQSLNAHGHGAEVCRQSAARQHDRRAKARQRQIPEQHRAFVAAPDRGDLVKERLFRVRIVGDVQHGEVRRDEGGHEAREGKGDRDKGDQRRALSGAAERGVAPAPTGERQARLSGGQGEGQDQRKRAQLDNH